VQVFEKEYKFLLKAFDTNTNARKAKSKNRNKQQQTESPLKCLIFTIFCGIDSIYSPFLSISFKKLLNHG